MATVKCPKCGANVEIDTGMKFPKCSFCSSQIYIGRSGAGFYYVLPFMSDQNAANGMFRRWAAGSKKAKDLDKVAQVTGMKKQYFPVYMFKGDVNGREQVMIEPPLPAGLRSVHPTWIEAALEGLPARARAALAGGNEPVDVWLARWATAVLPPMPVAPRDELERIIAREPAELVEWLANIGADQLAFAVGAEHAPTLQGRLAAAAARITKPPRVGALGPQRAAIARCRGVTLDDDLALLVVAGRALAPHLAAHQLAQRR